MTGPVHGLADPADAGAFLARLVRLDPRALVRLRADVAPGRVVIWARLPWAVLVSRTVAGAGPDGPVPDGPAPTATAAAPADVTVGAAELLAELERGGPALPQRRDAEWRWPLPPSVGTVVESLPATELRRIAAAAASALRSASAQGVAGRAVGERMLRDALLDHVAVVVTREPSEVRGGGWAPGSAASPAPIRSPALPERVEVPQRLVQAVVQMGFIRSSATVGGDAVLVRLSGRWVGLSAQYGVAWLPPAIGLGIRPR